MKNGLITDERGNKWWYLNDKLHRENAPAAEWANGNKYWYNNGALHKEDGPAVEFSDGRKEWWYEGKLMPVNSQEEFIKYLKLKAFW